ncbi:uncharacterized protein C8Q71DRAFT_416753 [Rhodofomes roseus]|uniref:Uncharacterized protein n=1 Tax=Rhodofomes roseus TaxID=34475 RepID=A0ABQ8KQ50_9APHY|nr:uncharacterized protein C8Q71DRAFT_416753 [Rhodofomes roseus]KAH9840635.1 hypothetical protein C8Q71DRAFT_416753 [Rhodofomes roseus]
MPVALIEFCRRAAGRGGHKASTLCRGRLSYARLRVRGAVVCIVSGNNPCACHTTSAHSAPVWTFILGGLVPPRSRARAGGYTGRPVKVLLPCAAHASYSQRPTVSRPVHALETSLIRSLSIPLANQCSGDPIGSTRSRGRTPQKYSWTPSIYGLPPFIDVVYCDKWHLVGRRAVAVRAGSIRRRASTSGPQRASAPWQRALVVLRFLVGACGCGVPR